MQFWIELSLTVLVLCVAIEKIIAMTRYMSRRDAIEQKRYEQKRVYEDRLWGTYGS